MPTETSVRSATVDDVRVIATLNRSVQELHQRFEPQEFGPFDESGTEAYVADRLARPSWFALVAEKGSTSIGYVLCEVVVRPDNAFTTATSFTYVHQIAVDSELRGSGVGTLLMSAVEQEAMRRGAVELRLDHWAFNEVADHFFAHLGFETYNVRMRKR